MFHRTKLLRSIEGFSLSIRECKRRNVTKTEVKATIRYLLFMVKNTDPFSRGHKKICLVSHSYCLQTVEFSRVSRKRFLLGH